LEEADAIKLFHNAVDRGINSSDNSWDYNQGASERRVGKALKGYRQKVFCDDEVRWSYERIGAERVGRVTWPLRGGLDLVSRGAFEQHKADFRAHAP